MSSRGDLEINSSDSEEFEEFEISIDVCSDEEDYADKNEEENKNGAAIEENATGFDKIEKILTMCVPNLVDHLPRFKEAMIINSSINFLKEKDVALIFQQQIGHRLIFMDALKRFKQSHSTKPHIFKDPNDTEIIEHEPGMLRDFKPFSKWRKIVRLLISLI